MLTLVIACATIFGGAGATFATEDGIQEEISGATITALNNEPLENINVQSDPDEQIIGAEPEGGGGSEVPALPTVPQGNGHITGTVTAAGTGVSLGGIGVNVYEYYPIGVNLQWQPVMGLFAMTAPDGTYDISGLEEGKYRVVFWENIYGMYIEEFYSESGNDARTVEAGTTVELTAENLTRSNINVQLDLGGRITGTVTEAGSGTPLSDISVTALRWVENAGYLGGGSWQSANSTVNLMTKSDGTYDIGGLDDGKYTIWCHDFKQEYLTEHYLISGIDDYDRNTEGFQVTAPKIVEGKDIQLYKTGKISGTVTGADGEPLPGISVGISVGAQPIQSGGTGTGTTDANGQYTVRGLTTGKYKVQFNDPNGQYQMRYYSTDGPVSQLDQAHEIDVTLGETTGNINTQLTGKCGSIVGQVNDENGPLSGVRLYLRPQDNDSQYIIPIPGNVTYSNGSFDAKGIPPGNYIVLFDDGSGRYMPMYYSTEGLVESKSEASIVTVKEEQQTTINAVQFTSAMLGGSISGTVTGNGNPLQGVNVYIIINEGIIFKLSVTDEKGRYIISGLPTGSHQVYFPSIQGQGFIYKYYAGPGKLTSDPDKALGVSVTAPGETSGIDANLTEKGTDPKVIVTKEPTVDERGIADATVDGDMIDEEIKNAEAAIKEEGGQNVKIKIDVPAAATEVKGVAVSLPKAQISAIANSDAVDALVITTEAGDFEIGSDVLEVIAQKAVGEETVTLSVTKEVAAATLPPQSQSQMAGAAVFDIELLAGTTAIHELGADIRVSLPYTLKSGETAANIRVYYLPEQGEPEIVSNAVYDSETGKISFSTNHLSLWAVKKVIPYDPNNYSYVPVYAASVVAAAAEAKYNVTFDANGGKISGKAKLVKSFKKGAKLGSLKTPTRKNYKFKGWYTKKSGGDKIGSGKKVAKRVTYYAHWQKKAQYGKIVKESTVSVRKSSKSGAARIGSLKKGQTFKVTSFINRAGKSNDWYKFKYKGKTGYVNAAYVKVSYK